MSSELDSSFPYVSKHRDDESDEHVRLKGMAVYWLLTRGFRLENIHPEHPVNPQRNMRQGRTGYTDIYASQDGVEVFIECETQSSAPLSKGGERPAKQGETVYVFSDEGIELVREVTKEFEPGNCVCSQETYTQDVLERQYISELPMIDLSAYK